MTALVQATRPLSRKAGLFMSTAAILAASTASMSVASMSTGVETVNVPAHLHVSSTLSKHNFATTKLRPIDFGKDPISMEPLATVGDSRNAQDVINSHVKQGGGRGAVAFVVRRPG